LDKASHSVQEVSVLTRMQQVKIKLHPSFQLVESVQTAPLL